MGQQLRTKRQKKSRSMQKQVALPGHVEKLLRDYSLGAAGIERRVRDFTLVAVGALALMSPSANADIVYSGPVDVNVAATLNAPMATFTLSLLGEPVLGVYNNFAKEGYFTATAHGRTSFVTTAFAHEDVVKRLGNAVLFFGSVSGAPIGAGKAIPGGVVGPFFFQSIHTFLGSGKFTSGTHDLLGFQFGTSHNRHNGWLGIGISQSSLGAVAGDVKVVDYAYEACPGDSISAGATTGGASCSTTSPTPEPNTLALLALGAAGLAAFRLRRKTKAA